MFAEAGAVPALSATARFRDSGDHPGRIIVAELTPFQWFLRFVCSHVSIMVTSDPTEVIEAAHTVATLGNAASSCFYGRPWLRTRRSHVRVMPGPTIAFVSPKGGTGKTTSAFLLSTALAKLYDVTVIDADPNHPIETWAQGGNTPERLTIVSDADEDNSNKRLM